MGDRSHYIGLLSVGSTQVCHQRSGERNFTSICVMENVLIFKGFWFSESQVRNRRPVVVIVLVLEIMVVVVVDKDRWGR